MVWSKPPLNPRFTPRCATRLLLNRCGGIASTQKYPQVFDDQFPSYFDLFTTSRRIKLADMNNVRKPSADFLTRRGISGVERTTGYNGA